MPNVKVISLFEKQTDPNGIYVNTTSSSESDWQRDLSPFFLGPCPLYCNMESKNMENAWQYSKVYPQHIDSGVPTQAYFDWAREGWNNPKAVRYPMGKGKIPLYSWWDGKKLGYVEGRKHIYVPLYARAVIQTKGFSVLMETYQECVEANATLYLRDYDAYRHEEKGMTLTDVLNLETKKCGHAFVLAMLLTKDPALHQCNIL